MSDEYLRDWTNPDITRRAMEALDRQMIQDSSDPGAGVRMCHAQGTTAVYVSEGGAEMIWHAQDGTITREDSITFARQRSSS